MYQVIVNTFRHLLFVWYQATDPNHDHWVQLGNRKLLYQRKLAEGGYGTVYLVHEINAPLGVNRWALKRVAASDRDLHTAFHREVQAHLSAQGHDRVMPLVASDLVGAGPAGIQGFLLMPFMEKGDLQQFVDKRMIGNEPLSISLVITLFRSICEAVQVFHSQDPPTVVSDIKPANLLICDDNQSVMITDLGSVTKAIRVVTGRTEANTLQDEYATTITAPYRPPELFAVPSQCTLDTRTDIWSLGCVLYFLIRGEPPFDGSESSARSPVEWDRIRTGDKLNELVVSMAKDMLRVEMRKRPTLNEVLQRLTAIC